MVLMILTILTSLEQAKFDLYFILDDFTANNHVAILHILPTCMVFSVNSLIGLLMSVVTLFLFNADSEPFYS